MAAARGQRSPPGGRGSPRPTQVTFAAVMLFVGGGLHLLLAIAEVTTAGVITVTIPGPAHGPHWLRGLLDLAFVVSFSYAGLQVWRGRRFGRMQGVVLAAVSALRWILHIPASPEVSVIAIVVDLLIIASLWTQSGYFRPS